MDGGGATKKGVADTQGAPRARLQVGQRNSRKCAEFSSLPRSVRLSESLKPQDEAPNLVQRGDTPVSEGLSSEGGFLGLLSRPLGLGPALHDVRVSRTGLSPVSAV